MFRLLLLLLVGTIYAQDFEDPVYNDFDEIGDPNTQEDEDEMSDDLETTSFNEYELEEELKDLLYNDTNELEDPGSLDDGDDLLNDLEANSDNHDLEDQPAATIKIKDKNKKFGLLRIFTRALSFARAENFCERRHGDLTSVHSRRINGRMKRMMKKIKKKHAWIGVWKPWRLGKYQNVDQTPMDYSWFERRQRRKKGVWCVAMNILNGRWGSRSCKRRLPFFCRS